MNVKTL